MGQQHKVCTACGYVGKAIFLLTKFSSIKCPKCECMSMVPLRSMEGQAVLAQRSGQPRVWDDTSSMLNIK